MADELDKLVYVLSYCRPVREYAPIKPAIDQSDKKHLDLLNDIALVLTTRAKGDGTAVTMKHSATAIEFFYSKNAPCDGALDAYLEEIKNAIAGNDNLQTIYAELLRVIVSRGIQKFTSRAAKCKLAVTSHDSINPSTDNTLPNDLDRWRQLSPLAIVATFLNDLRNLDTSAQALQADIKKCMNISHEACLIGSGSSLRHYPMLLRRVQKLGAYFGAAGHVTTLLTNPTSFKLRGSINFIEIPPMPLSNVLVPRNLANLLNEHAKGKLHGEQVALEDMAIKFPSLSFPETGSAPVRVSTHCELTQALHALRSPSKPATIQIGVSKRLCWLCQKFFENLNGTGAVRVLASENQGKIHAGWRMPLGTPSEVDSGMRHLIEWEIEELRNGIVQRRRSNPFPNEERDDLSRKLVSGGF
ncbi:hypothetical protein MMC07_008912 [Pseudocyphellaria aurata]|nr:hypothetical protein [Pseudocyphellaria aurata]